MASQTAGVGTFNAAMGSAGSTCTGVFGGSKLTWQAAYTLAVATNVVNVQTGIYSVSGRVTIGSYVTTDCYHLTQGDLDATLLWSNIVSYGALLTTSTNSVSPLILTNAAASTTPIVWNNCQFSNTSSIPAEAFASNNHGATWIFNSVRILGTFTKGIDCDDGTYDDCYQVDINRTEITGTTVYAFDFNQNGGCRCWSITDSYIHDTIANDAAVYSQGGDIGNILRTVVARTSGLAASDVTTNTGTILHIKDSAFTGATVAGVYISNMSGVELFSENSIYYNNGVWGIQAVPSAAYIWLNNNAAGANGVGNFEPGTDPNLITLTADPWVDDAHGNFALNNTAGGGALLKNLGFPGSTPFGAGYASGGPLEPQPAAPSSGGGPYGFDR